MYQSSMINLTLFNIALVVADKFPLSSGSWRHKLMPTIEMLICIRMLEH